MCITGLRKAKVMGTSIIPVEMSGSIQELYNPSHLSLIWVWKSLCCRKTAFLACSAQLQASGIKKSPLVLCENDEPDRCIGNEEEKQRQDYAGPMLDRMATPAKDAWTTKLSTGSRSPSAGRLYVKHGRLSSVKQPLSDWQRHALANQISLSLLSTSLCSHHSLLLTLLNVSSVHSPQWRVVKNVNIPSLFTVRLLARKTPQVSSVSRNKTGKT